MTEPTRGGRSRLRTGRLSRDTSPRWANPRSLRKIIGHAAQFQDAPARRSLASRGFEGGSNVAEENGRAGRPDPVSFSRRPSTGSALRILSEPRNIENRERSYSKGA